MIFDDYVVKLNKSKNELEKIKDIIGELNCILNLSKTWNKFSFEKAYLKLINSNSNSGSVAEANSLSNQAVTYFSKLRENLICIDFLPFGEILGYFNSVNLVGLEEKISDMYSDFSIAYTTIHEYKKLIDEKDRVVKYIEFIDAVDLIVGTYNEFNYMVDCINEINNGLNRGIIENTFEIRLLNNSFNKGTFSKINEPMYIIYEKLCEIANINNPKPLEIVRMETGSFLERFVGEESIFKIIEKILESVHNIWIRNFTREGKKQNLVESTDLLKEQLDIVHEMKELGLDVDEHYEVAKETLVQIMKQSNILISSSSDIKINNKVLSKSKDLKNRLSAEEFMSLPENDKAV